jgi:hypothetical protein
LENVLNNALVGIEFEFYSKLPIEKAAKSIGEKLGKKIIVPYSVTDILNPRPLYHSPIEPKPDIFKLEPDYSGGKDMRELITGPLPYKEARNIIIRMFEWINDNGYTNNRCSIHLNISVKGQALTVDKMNTLYFILSFDESKVYDKFPNRKDSVYARSISKIVPNTIAFYNSMQKMSRETMEIPSEKYFGVNFLKQEKGYLEYRYIGGDNYHKKRKDILECLEYFITHQASVLNWNESQKLSPFVEKKWNEYLERYNKIIKAYHNPEDCIEIFPDLKITVDLKNNIQILKTYWGLIQPHLYRLLTSFDMDAGKINYDTDLGAFEIKNANISGGTMKYVHFYNCKLEGAFEGCFFTNCEIKNSRILQCNFLGKTNVWSSKIQETYLKPGQIMTDCFIENKNSIIDCTVEKGVIRDGIISKNAKISKETLIVFAKKAAETLGNSTKKSKKN